MGELIKVLPDIIKEASQSTLGIFALLVVVLGLLAWRFFQHASIRVRIVIWSLILAGTIGFAVAFVRASHDATGATSVFNVETRIKEWLSLLKVVPRKVDVSDSLIRIGGYTHPGAFGYEITTRENDKMTLWRETKERPEYLQVWSYLPISPQDQALLNTLTREQRLEVARTVAQDLNKVPMGNKSLPEYSEHFTGFLIAISVPLATLTRYTFGDDIDKVDNATVIARNDLAMSLEPFRHLSSTALPPAPAIQLGRPFLGVSELALVKNDQGTWIAQKGTIVVSGSTPAHDVRAIVGAYARFDYSFSPNEKDFKWMKYIVKKKDNNQIAEEKCLRCWGQASLWKGELPPISNFRDWVGAPIKKRLGDIAPGPLLYSFPLPVASSGILVLVVYGDLIYFDESHKERDTQFCYYIPPNSDPVKCDGFNEIH